MKFETKIKIVLWKNYFETGYAITNYAKYFIILFGAYDIFINKNNVNLTLFLGILYAIFCFIIGYFWFKGHFQEASAEVGNRYNPLLVELRKRFKLKNKLK